MPPRAKLRGTYLQNLTSQQEVMNDSRSQQLLDIEHLLRVVCPDEHFQGRQQRLPHTWLRTHTDNDVEKMFFSLSNNPRELTF